MPAYVIADIEVLDPVAYEEYKRLASPTPAQFGGRYIVRGAPVQGWKTLAHTYRKLGLFEDAIRVMEQAREMDPSDETIPRNLDLLRRMLEQQEQGEPPADR